MRILAQTCMDCGNGSKLLQRLEWVSLLEVAGYCYPQPDCSGQLPRSHKGLKSRVQMLNKPKPKPYFPFTNIRRSTMRPFTEEGGGGFPLFDSCSDQLTLSRSIKTRQLYVLWVKYIDILPLNRIPFSYLCVKTFQKHEKIPCSCHFPWRVAAAICTSQILSIVETSLEISNEISTQPELVQGVGFPSRQITKNNKPEKKKKEGKNENLIYTPTFFCFYSSQKTIKVSNKKNFFWFKL